MNPLNPKRGSISHTSQICSHTSQICSLKRRLRLDLRRRMAAAKEKLPAPDGTRPMMISMREMDTLGLKTGSGLRETVEFKLFSKGEILDQINQMGFMCPFHEFRSEIQV